jgi:dephospho-CoA kinase
MYVVGLTGGIGSGKTAVSDHLKALGITVVDADIVSRQVVEPGTEALLQIQKHFGDNIINTDRVLDRAKLREIIFHNPSEKTWLEQLLHPLIGAETFRQIEAANGPYVLYVTPLLTESGQHEMCDDVIVVDVAEQTQIERTTVRDSNSEKTVKAIIASQANRQERLKIATHVINNDSTLADLLATTESVHQQLLINTKGRQEQ